MEILRIQVLGRLFSFRVNKMYVIFIKKSIFAIIWAEKIKIKTSEYFSRPESSPNIGLKGDLRLWFDRTWGGLRGKGVMDD